MRDIWRGGVAIELFFFCFILVVPFATAELTCSIEEQPSCTTGTRLLGLENETGGIYNAHVELGDRSTYLNSLCCGSSEGTIGTSCADEVVFHLSDAHNAHITSSQEYDTSFCISHDPGGVFCELSQGTCVEGTCLLSVSDERNGHVSSCGTYPLSLCCKITPAVEQLVQQEAIVGQPVKWKKSLPVQGKSFVRVTVPSQTQDISVHIVGEKTTQTLHAENLRTTKGETVSVAIERNSKLSTVGKGFFAQTLSVFRADPEEITVDFPVDPTLDFVDVVYETEAPRLLEKDLGNSVKQLTITSETHYTNILSSYHVGNVPKDAIQLDWITNGRRERIHDITYIDEQEDGLVDRIEWIVPHLSDQVYELNLTILNPVAFLKDGETWIVRFATVGVGDLTIFSPNANWEELPVDNLSTTNEMEFLSLFCGENNITDDLLFFDVLGNEYSYEDISTLSYVQPVSWLYEDFSCPNETAYFSNYMNIAGYAVLNFTFTDGENTVTMLAIDPEATLDDGDGLLEDTKWDEGSPSSTFGTLVNFFVRANSGDDQVAPIKFNASEMNITAGSTIDDCTLILEETGSSDVVQIQVWQTNDTGWDETVTTWNTAFCDLNSDGTIDETNTTDGCIAKLGSNTSNGGLGTLTFDVSSAITDTTENVTFVLESLDGVGDEAVFFSNDHGTASNRPALKCNWTEPASLPAINMSVDILVPETTPMNVTQNQFFNFSINVTCDGGYCGNVTAYLDPEVLKSDGAAIDADTRLREGAPTTNYGSGTRTAARALHTDDNFAVMRVNVTELNITSGSTIDYCFLNLTEISGISGVTLYMWNSTNTTWDESTITWNTNFCNHHTNGTINEASPGECDTMIATNTSSGSIGSSMQFNITTSIYPDIELATFVIESRTSETNDVSFASVDHGTSSYRPDVYCTWTEAVGKGGLISTTPGTIPFYTTDDNPQNASDVSCLQDMNESDSCVVSWQVNATGALHNSFTFYAYVEAQNMTGQQNSSMYTITISSTTAPTHANPGLYTTDHPYNSTYANLTGYNQSTIDADGDAVYNTYDFRLEGTSLAILHMPFNVNVSDVGANQTVDYSTYSHNGTLGGGTSSQAPTWNATGIVGGHYDFDGSNDYILIGNSSELNSITGNMTACAWVYPRSFGEGSFGMILNKRQTGPNGGFAFNIANGTSGSVTVDEGFVLYFYNNADYVHYNSSITLSSWHHLCAVHDDTANTAQLYLNGSLVANESSISNMNSHGSANLWVGQRTDGTNEFDGYIDQVVMFNRSLSSDQISLIFTDERDNATFRRFADDETIVGQNWTVAVTPSDGVIDGITRTSSTIQIQSNGPPTHETPILNSTDGGYNSTDANLTGYNQTTIDPNGDGFVNTFDWRVNGSSYAVLNAPFNTNISHLGTNGIRDYSTHENNGTLGSGTSSYDPAWNTSGRIGGSYTFDGNNDTINFGNSSSLNNMSELTILLWVRPESTGSTRRLVDKGNAADATNGWFFDLSNTGQLLFEADFGSVGAANNLDRRSNLGTGIGNGAWTHVAVVWDGSSSRSGVDFYVNATETPYTGGSDGSGSRVSDVNRSVYVGSSGSITIPFEGSIDEVLILNRSVSQDYIQLHFETGRDNVSYSTLVSNETTVDDNWTIAITPSDGQADGLTRVSSLVTITNNAAPRHSAPILNATDNPTNSSSANLTVYLQDVFDVNGDSVKNITNWYVGGTSLEVVNMQFEGTSTASFTRDYSGNGINGTVNGATYSATGGNDGFGAYSFDGVNDYIDLGIQSLVNFTTQPFTVTGWVNLDATSSETIIGTDNTTTGWEVSITSNRLAFTTRGTTDVTTSSSATLNTGQWIHIAAVYTGTGGDRILYLNGSHDSTEDISGSVSGSTNELYIGRRNGTSNPLDGSIAGVRVYNRSLSANQILEIYQNNSLIMASDELSPGENWSACVTVTDGNDDGDTLCSNGIVIVNGGPTHSTPVMNATDNPLNRTAANLTAYNQSTSDPDQDTVYNVHDWRIGGTSIATLNLPFNTDVSVLTTGAILDYSTYQNNGTLGNGASSGQPTWNSSCLVGGCYTFNGTNDTILIASSSSLDNMSAVTFVAWVYPYGTSAAARIVDKETASAGTNGWHFELTSSDIPRFIADFGTVGSTQNLVVQGNGAISTTSWTHIAFTWDGSAESDNVSFYVNGTETGYGSQTDGTGSRVSDAGQDLRIGRQSTSEDRPFNGSIDQVLIFDRVLSQDQIQALFANDYSLIVSNETSYGEVWTVAITPSDSTTDGSTLVSNSVTIQSSPPTTPTLLTPVDSNGTVFDRFTYFDWTDSTHPDGFDINYTFQINESPSCGAVTDKNVTTSEYTSTDELCVDNEYNWSARACDKFLMCSDYASPFNFSIASVVSLVFTTDTVNLSSLEPSTPATNFTNSTFDNNPAPFLITNDGNLDINIDVQATVALWADAALNTIYWQYADQATTSWVNVSGSYQDFYDGLAWTGTDTREMEINVTVPLSEDPGSKQGTLQALAANAE